MAPPRAPTVLALLGLCLAAACPGSAAPGPTEAVQTCYRDYLQASSQAPLDQGRLEAWRAACCTRRLRDRLRESEPDADPFLDAQDLDERWAESLRVVEGSAEGRLQACYRPAADGPERCVPVAVAREDGRWKLDEVGG